MTWKMEVTTAGDRGQYAGNALRFATQDEADEYGLDLASRWTAVTDYRCVECSDPVTHEWVAGEGLRSVDSDEAPRMPARRVTL